MIVRCGKCKTQLADADAQCCWYCEGALCWGCWDSFGHCGHPEAAVMNAAARTMTREQRAGIARALYPDAEHLVPRGEEAES